MEEQKTFYLLPGALFVKKDNYMVTTILGSCVALCLYDTKLEYGGIIHFMLPQWNGNGLASPKYGDIAIKKLVSQMLNYGSSKKQLIAKLFGGASVLETSSSEIHVGQKNINIALLILKELDIKIVSKNIGGNLGRKILFNTSTGVVYHKYLNKLKVSNK